MKTRCSLGWVAALVLGGSLGAVPATKTSASGPAQPLGDAHAPVPGKETPAPSMHPEQPAGNSAARAAERPFAQADDFERSDTDHDGRISKEEFLASDATAVDAVAAGKRRGSKSFNRGDFRHADQDRDGALTRQEWDAARAAAAASEKR